MQGEWAGVKFDYIKWRETGTCILRGLDELQMLLDDQIVKTQSMRASPYIGPFEDRVKLWEAKLNTMQEIVDEWLKCQQAWLYLEPIFGSEDIMQVRFIRTFVCWAAVFLSLRLLVMKLSLCSH